MEQIVAAQRAFFNTNRTKELAWRIGQLKQLRALLQAHEQRLYQAIHADFGKSEFDTFTSELSLLYSEINENISQLKRWAKPKMVRTDLANFPAKSYIMPEPLGVSLIIGTWNYPFYLNLLPAISAIGAGNTAVLKPSELAPECSKVMAEMINTLFDPAFLKVVEGGVPETTALLAQRFDKIFFTGSTAVGKIVYQAAAPHLTPVTLELGGKSPAIITQDCDLNTTVRRLVWAKFFNAGQTCVAPDYVLVHESIEQAFLERAKQEIKQQQFAVAHGNYVQIINSRNLQRLAGLLDKEKVFCGGTYDEATRVFEPTLMRGVSFEDAVMQEEIFGPILPVIAYQSLDAAIAKIKEGAKPLSCYIFTSNKASKRKLLHEVSFGGGAVNDALMHLSNSRLPFGGVGYSGMGSYHGEHGFRTFSHHKSVLDKPTWFEPNLKYHPRTAGKLKWIKRLMGLG